jgi:hypothetical protein
MVDQKGYSRNRIRSSRNSFPLSPLTNGSIFARACRTLSKPSTHNVPYTVLQQWSGKRSWSTLPRTSHCYRSPDDDCLALPINHRTVQCQTAQSLPRWSWLTKGGKCPESKLWDMLEVLPGLEPWISNNSLYIHGLNERKTSLRSRPNYLFVAFY